MVPDQDPQNTVGSGKPVEDQASSDFLASITPYRFRTLVKSANSVELRVIAGRDDTIVDVIPAWYKGMVFLDAGVIVISKGSK